MILARVNSRALLREISGVARHRWRKIGKRPHPRADHALLIGLNIRHKGHGGIRITGLPPDAYK